MPNLDRFSHPLTSERVRYVLVPEPGEIHAIIDEYLINYNAKHATLPDAETVQDVLGYDLDIIEERIRRY